MMQKVILIIFTILLTGLNGFSQDIFPLRNEKGLWGYCSLDGKVKILFIYESAELFFSSGKAIVGKNGVFGMIDKQGKEVLPFEYSEIETRRAFSKYHHCKSLEVYGRLSGFVNENGVPKISCNYNGFLMIGGCEGNYNCSGFLYPNSGKTLIDTNGKVISTNQFDEIGRFSEGKAAAVVNSNLSFIDKTGKIVIPFNKYYGSSFNQFSEGLCAVQNAFSMYGYIDSTGKEVIPCQYKLADEFSEGLAAVMQKNKYGYINKSGKLIIDCKFEYGPSFYQSKCFVKEGNQFYIIDKTGRKIMDFPYEDAQAELKYDIINVKKNGKWGFVNSKNEKITDFNYDMLSSNLFTVEDGYISVSKNNKYGIIDGKGKEIIPIQYDRIGFTGNHFLVTDTAGLSGLIDKDGKIITNCIYSNINPFINGYALVEKINYKGKGLKIENNSEEGNFTHYSEMFIIDSKGNELKFKKLKSY